jgi:hypothetical protein
MADKEMVWLHSMRLSAAWIDGLWRRQRMIILQTDDISNWNQICSMSYMFQNWV